MTPNKHRAEKLAIWALVLMALAAFTASAWQPWTLILTGGFFIISLFFLRSSLLVSARDDD